MLDLDALVKQANSLQPLPASAAKLATLIAGPDPDMQAVVGVVEHDPAFAAALLRRANSAAAGANRTISTVREAVTRLGASAVLTVVTALSARKTVDRAIPEYGLAEGELWAHSRATAIAADLIGRMARVRPPPETSTTALLHDVGKLVLARFLDEDTRRFLDAAFAQSLSYRKAEREVLGVTQAELGGILADRWSLPHSIVQGIVYCHAPFEYAETLAADDKVLVICHAVHLANFLAKCVGSEFDQNSDSRIKIERTSGAVTFDETVLDAMKHLAIAPSGFSTLVTQLRAALAAGAE